MLSHTTASLFMSGSLYDAFHFPSPPMLSLLFSLLLTTASAADMLREVDMTPERQVFQTVPLSANGVTIEDPATADDVTVFDRTSGQGVPTYVPDITRVTVVPTDDGWLTTFTVRTAIPENPGIPVNFDLFLDSDGKSDNNAKDGVFRAGSDRVYLLLFGTSTKWHTMTWQFNPADGRWAQLTTPIPFKVDGKKATMTIPYTLWPKTSIVGTARAFSLAAMNGGASAVDVAPGTGLPPLRSGQVAQQPVAPSSVTAQQNTASPAFALSMPIIVIVVLVVVIAGALLLSRAKMPAKKQHTHAKKK